NTHGVARRKAELARRFLLQRRSRERRRRVPGKGLRLNRRDGEVARFDHRLGSVRVTTIADRQAVDLLAVELRQAGRESLPVRLERGAHLPIFLRLENLDLALAVDDQAQRNRLDAPGGFRAGKL